jgi:SAM-dependent methyltransferase
VTTPRTRTGYDRVAASYDGHFRRNVDRWEDEVLANLLAPLVYDKSVLDLGCGTGWLLDHTRPRSYLGLDRSPEMALVCMGKHTGAEVVVGDVGATGWWKGDWRDAEAGRRFDVVCATWAAEYFRPLDRLLAQIVTNLLRRPGVIALHGCQPRGSARAHFIDPDLAHTERNWSPGPVRKAARRAGLANPESFGIGAMPDELARRKWLWQAGLFAPLVMHYSVLHVWRLA